MLSAKEIRSAFIDFFRGKEHAFVPSSPIVPHDDETLLFANAGMNQFKDIFLGLRAPDGPRAVNSQKCLRVSGKHNDLEEVGKDTYHHTFFEMLGNWSFNDYFKAEAIAWAWELLTTVWQINPDQLWATIFEGDAQDGLPRDDEAAKLWVEQTPIPAERVLPFGKKDNFWEMGETGPCGPCSEIHIDLGPDRCDKKEVEGHECRVNGDCARYIELWNLVFIQYNRQPSGRLVPLSARYIDTGAGLERVTAVLQGKRSNYDTDLFMPIIERTAQMSAHKYTGQLGNKTDNAFRVIADHSRTLVMAITDGATPSNEGRGYVIRRILRRAARFGRELDLHEPFLHKLVPVVIEVLGDAFPEARDRAEHVATVIQSEEASFGRTLDRGLEMFNAAAARSVSKKHKTISGEDAFQLYDTYGFPIDLTQLLAEERGLRVDLDRFHELMMEQRERARAAKKTDALLAGLADSDLPATEDLHKYETDRCEATVVGWVDADGFKRQGQMPTDTEIGLVLDRTCFYAEAGGQVGDQGLIVSRSMGVPPMSSTAVPAVSTTGILPVTQLPIAKRHGARLPHWTQAGATYAVTFRLADSLPADVVQSWKREREEIEKRAKAQNRSLTWHERMELQHLYSTLIDSVLNKGQGACYLRDERTARMVQDALEHFHGDRYELTAWAIMPNHVHVVVRPLGDHPLPEILHSWKSFTAKQANKLLDRSGPFWQEEYYDHLIRDEQDFRHAVEYVLSNPEQAGLENWPWVGLQETAAEQDTSERHGRDAHATHGQDARATFVVEATTKVGNAVIHRGRLTDGSLQPGQAVTAIVSRDRNATKKNHTATHLLQWALQQVLGDSVAQQGSFVGPDYLRFDFTYSKAPTPEELKEIERLVREKIAADLPVSWAVLPREKAEQLGAMALFGEKYGSEVRVICVGAPDIEHIDQAFSREFCGGTHVDHLGAIGSFKVLKEESVSAGVRRITALTGPALTSYLERGSDIVDQLAGLLQVPADKLPDRVSQLLEDNKKLAKQLKTAAKAGGPDTMAEARDLLDAGERIGESAVVVGRLSTTTPDRAREAIDMLKKKAGSAAILLAYEDDGKVTLLSGVTDDLIKKVKAGDIVKQVAPIVDGGGGGRPQMAQAGGKNPAGIDEALTKATELIRTTLSG